MKPQKMESVLPKSKPEPESDLERMPSLTTLRAELSDVHAHSFKGARDDQDFDPRKSKLDRLKQSTDQRSKMLPSRQEEEIPDVESVPSLTTLREELSGVHAQSFNPEKGNLVLDISDSKLDALKDNSDDRPVAFQKISNSPELQRDPSLTTLRAELSEVHARSFRPAKGEPDWDPSKSKLEMLKGNTDQRSKHLPSHLKGGPKKVLSLLSDDNGDRD